MPLRRRRPGRRAAGWAIRVLVVVAVALAVLVGPIDTSGRSTPETARITSYDVAMDLGGDGELVTDERITVDMPPGKRGIFRFFDTADPRRDGVDHPVSVLLVERDGGEEAWTDVDSAPGTRSIRLGRESVFLDPGLHDYRILSSTKDVLEPGADDGETLWWWDVVGKGWQMPMESVSVTADLPATPLRAECVQDADTPCEARVVENTLTVRTGPLEPFTPVTVRVAFDADDVAAPDPGTDTTTTALWSVLAALVGAGVAVLLGRRTREAAPGFPVLFEPPFMTPPALGVKVLDEVDSEHALQATLFDLAQRGVVLLQGDDDSWTVQLVDDRSGLALHPVESAVLDELALTAPGDTFRVSDTTSSGKRVAAANKGLARETAAAATRYLHSSGVGVLALVLGWTAVAAVLVMAALRLFGGAEPPWPVFALAAGYAVVAGGLLTRAGVVTVRTAEGRDLWSRTGGFARFMTTEGSESRFDASAHLDWYPRYLPWAVALGVADRWAERFTAQGVDLPEVPWLLWTGTGHFTATSMNRSFDSAITSASAAYAASQASSGGGGGFSGGSGGGGGGGGSW